MKKIHKLSSCAILIGVFFTGITYAATSGTSDITAPINQVVSISNTQDLEFTGGIDPLANADATKVGTTCVYSNHALNKYKVTVSGDATNGFELSDASNGNTLDYSISWKHADTASFADVSHGSMLPADQTGSASPSCNDSKVSSFKITIDTDDIQAAQEGTYTGILTIDVSAP